MTVLDYLTASIVVDGKPCQEYAVDVPEPANLEVLDLEKPRPSKLRPRSTKQDPEKFEKYVEAVGGSHFEVRIGVRPIFDFDAGNCLVAEIYLNGKDAEGTLHHEADLDHVDGFHFLTCRGAVLDSRKVIQRFRFANITTREGLPEDDIEALKSQHKDLGTIEVKFSRVRTTQAGRGGVHPLRSGPSLDGIPEKVVKGEAISMAASFGDTEMVVGDCSRCNIEYTDRLPVAIFLFMCRSKRDLQLLRVIPRSPSPVPLEHRPVEELSLEEARELIKRQQLCLHTETSSVVENEVQKAAEVTRLRIKHEATKANLNDLRSLKHHRSDDAGSNDNEVEVVASHSKRQRLLPTAEDEVVDLRD